MRYLFNDNESEESEFNSHDEEQSKDDFRQILAQIMNVIICVLALVAIFLMLTK